MGGGGTYSRRVLISHNDPGGGRPLGEGANKSVGAN